MAVEAPLEPPARWRTPVTGHGSTAPVRNVAIYIADPGTQDRVVPSSGRTASGDANGDAYLF